MAMLPSLSGPPVGRRGNGNGHVRFPSVKKVRRAPHACKLAAWRLSEWSSSPSGRSRRKPPSGKESYVNPTATGFSSSVPASMPAGELMHPGRGVVGKVEHLSEHLFQFARLKRLVDDGGASEFAWDH